MSSSDDEKYENKSKKQSFQNQLDIDYSELPRIKTKIVNKIYTRKILKHNIEEKKAIMNYLKEKLREEERKLQVFKCDLEKVELFYINKK